MIITAAAEEEGRLTGLEANLFPPFPICGRIAPLSTYSSISWEFAGLQVLQCIDGEVLVDNSRNVSRLLIEEMRLRLDGNPDVHTTSLSFN